jgi:hypothetical protein
MPSDIHKAHIERLCCIVVNNARNDRRGGSRIRPRRRSLGALKFRIAYPPAMNVIDIIAGESRIRINPTGVHSMRRKCAPTPASYWRFLSTGERGTMCADHRLLKAES